MVLIDIRQPGDWRDKGALPQARLIAHVGNHARVLARRAPHPEGRPVALIRRTGTGTAQAAGALAPALPVPVIDIAGALSP